MYRKIIFITGLLSSIIFSGCEKDNTDGVSKVYKVPTIELIGPNVVSLRTGSTYTDQGATFHDEDGTTSPITASTNPVNTAVEGFYQVIYKKKSKSEIYEAEAVRIVVVTNVSDPVDYSGTYMRPATGVPAIVQKVANGVYKVTNPGGAGVGTGVVVYFAQLDNNTWLCPVQPTVAGPFGVNTITFTATGSSWKVENAGYGTGLRTFEKQ